MKHISHHILGDTKYGRGEHNKMIRKEYECHRLLLHSHYLKFQHPKTDQEIVLVANVDETFERMLGLFNFSLDVPLDRYKR
jgi:tRNA pseudouridine65 synthase